MVKAIAVPEPGIGWPFWPSLRSYGVERSVGFHIGSPISGGTNIEKVKAILLLNLGILVDIFPGWDLGKLMSPGKRANWFLCGYRVP